jgi:hypothetical protein
MIDTEKYQPARQNMKFVTRSLNITADTSIFVFSREKLHDSKYSKDASPKA